jgi:hypothetical protein
MELRWSRAGIVEGAADRVGHSGSSLARSQHKESPSFSSSWICAPLETAARVGLPTGEMARHPCLGKRNQWKPNLTPVAPATTAILSTRAPAAGAALTQRIWESEYRDLN